MISKVQGVDNIRRVLESWFVELLFVLKYAIFRQSFDEHYEDETFNICLSFWKWLKISNIKLVK